MPAIYEDELLYSIVARYGAMTGYRDAVSANLDLFGRAFGHAATVLPSNLDALALRMPASLGITGRDLALNHTPLKYHCAFRPEDATEKAIAVACADGGYHKRPTRTREKPLRTPTQLRFCPECLEKMERDGQDLHWKRVHQLAIVVVCPEHGCDLRMNRINPHPNDKRLHPATRDSCNPDAPPVVAEGAIVDRQLLLDFATSARTLLDGGYPPGMDRDSGPAYAQVFRDLGYYRKGRLHWDNMLPALRQSLTGITQALPGVETLGSDPMGWFALSLSTVRAGHADRVLIAAAAARRIEALEPRFWAAADQQTGRPFMSLDAAA